MSPTRAALVAMLATLTALAVWFVLYALVFSGLQEAHTQHVMYTRLRSYLAQEKVPFGGVIAPGTPVALITAPSIHLRSVVVEGTSSRDLSKGPGHYPSSPFPGQAGVSVIFGRSATFGAPFAKIASLRPGAPILVTTGQGRAVFRVNDVRRPGDPLPAVLPATASALTLATSAGSGWRSGWAPTQVVYVDASLVSGKVWPTPPGRPAAVPAADKALASDTGNLIVLVLWLQAMVLVVAGLLYARPRVTAWQLWVVGLPMVIAVLWGATSTTLILLPNLA
jgi:sortase A